LDFLVSEQFDNFWIQKFGRLVEWFAEERAEFATISKTDGIRVMDQGVREILSNGVTHQVPGKLASHPYKFSLDEELRYFHEPRLNLSILEHKVFEFLLQGFLLFKNI
jgi:hypothetical protein